MNSTPEQTYSNWIAAERALVFVTCPRTPRYINATLASAYSTSDVAKHFGHVSFRGRCFGHHLCSRPGAVRRDSMDRAYI
jgi:hypothetical protein